MKILFFTGAGISAESGIQTFRDTDGLWNNHKIDEVCNINTWEQNKDTVFKFYSERRKHLGTVNPNAIHYGIAELQEKLGVENVSVVTQNVDDLLERAGVKNVIHVHGFLTEMKCTKCGHIFDVGYTDNDKSLKCPECSGDTKPNIVFFGELAPNYHFMKRKFKELNNSDYLVVMGTLGNVVNINEELDFIFGKKILNNLEKSPYINDRKFDHVLYEPGTSAILKIKDKFLNNEFIPCNI